VERPGGQDLWGRLEMIGTMSQPHGETTNLLDGLRTGDAEARSKLLNHACERLRFLTSKMLRVDFPGVQRWEQTNDVLQNSLIRLHRALLDVTPKSPRHFWNLAALQIRRELLDLAHHYLGPQGQGARHHTDGTGKAADDSGRPFQTRSDHSGSRPPWKNGPVSTSRSRPFQKRSGKCSVCCGTTK